MKGEYDYISEKYGICFLVTLEKMQEVCADLSKAKDENKTKLIDSFTTIEEKGPPTIVRKNV